MGQRRERVRQAVDDFGWYRVFPIYEPFAWAAFVGGFIVVTGIARLRGKRDPWSPFNPVPGGGR